MSRFSQAFLRDRLGGRTYLGAFGKHPAWNDHMGLIGAKTETLALLEDILYRQGIAAQIAAGSWHDSQGEAKSVEFNHRFVWCRGEQSLVGALWRSTDGKGRGQFPFVCCVQGGMRGTAALQVYLDYVVKVGGQAREAPDQSEVQTILERAGCDLNLWNPVAPTAVPLTLTPEQAPTARNALCSLVQKTVPLTPVRQPPAGGSQDASVRLPSLSTSTSENLCYYAGFLEQLSPAPPIYLLISHTDPDAPVDCVPGEPGSGVFFCLGADLGKLPIVAPPGLAALPERSYRSVDRFLAACAAGTLPEPTRRRFWHRFT